MTCGSMPLGLASCFAIAFLASLVPAAAQTAPDIRFLNPDTIGPPRGYSHVVDVNRPVRIVYLAGQLGFDLQGKPAGDFRAQATQTYENIKNALAAVGADFKDVVKINVYLTDIRAQIAVHREVRDKYVNTAAPPASTTIEIPRLAREGALIEVEAVAVTRAR